LQIFARAFAKSLPFEAKHVGLSSYRIIAMFRLSVLASLCLATLAFQGPVLAQDNAPISVNMNMARVLRISAPAATVIVGNPGIADVTIQDPMTLILTGKSYGQTNLIVLDAGGEPIADTLIEVMQMQAGVMTVYQGQSRTTLTCAPVCQPTVAVGDDNTFTTQTLASSQLVQSIGN
jgi:Flp pilus assembly secretin CpaC